MLRMPHSAFWTVRHLLQFGVATFLLHAERPNFSEVACLERRGKVLRRRARTHLSCMMRLEARISSTARTAFTRSRFFATFLACKMGSADLPTTLTATIGRGVGPMCCSSHRLFWTARLTYRLLTIPPTEFLRPNFSGCCLQRQEKVPRRRARTHLSCVARPETRFSSTGSNTRHTAIASTPCSTAYLGPSRGRRNHPAPGHPSG